MQQVYRQSLTATSLVRYHVLWLTRRRKPVLSGIVALRLPELMGEVAAEIEVEILSLQIEPRYVCALLDCPATLAPHQVVHRMKGYTARYLRSEFPHLQSLPSMWTRSYLISTAETLSEETIREYISSQKKKG